MDKFVHLHNHCEYSLLDGYGHPDWFVKRAKELGQTAIAITDHGSVSSHYRWYESCKEAGIKPILGCEMYVVDKVEDKTRGYYHITVLAKNLEGYRNLMKLVSFSYNEGFYYKPKVDWKIFKQYSKGLIVTSGCPSGKTGEMIKIGASKLEIINEIKRQREIFDDYFIELAPWDFEEGRIIARVMYDIALEQKIPMLMTMDCHYPLKEHAEVQDVLLCVQTGVKFEDPKRLKFDQQDFYLKSSEEMKASWESCYPDLPFKEELINNTAKVADMVDFEFPLAKPIEFPYKGDKVALLKRMAWKGMKQRGLDKKENYIARAKRELELIVEKDFVDYFLVIADLIQWSKKNGIFVGPARGSSCGSLICYVTHITEIDPIEYDLLFERFIDVNRTDLPDVDIDFEDERREEVKDYLRSKYGQDRVASIATFGTFKGRLCVQDVGKVFSVPAAEVEEVKKLIVQRSGGDSRFGYSVEDTFESFEKAAAVLEKHPQLKYAKHIEGQIRHLGVHAAGTIVSNEPIENFAAFYKSSKGEKVISMDYHDVSAIGLLKIDLLGLTAMSVIKQALMMIKQRTGKDIDMLKIKLDDPKVYESFQKGKMFGIFQFDGMAMMAVCKQVKPENFHELIAVNALSRPGPLHSGGTNDYIDRKMGRKQVIYLHPLLERLTGDTYGVTIYQEQVMMTVKELGNFTWGETSTIRKIMSKNVGVESFNKFEQKFVSGAKENGVDEDIAKEIWSKIYSFGSWAFNKSHCVAYTMIGYWMMWLKVYYPLEFYSAMLQKEHDEVKVRKIVKEFVADGNNLYPVDINRSKESFSIDGDGIRVGFQDIKGIGGEIAKQLVANQPYIDFNSVKVGSSAKDKLMRIGAFKNLDLGQHQPSLFGEVPKIDIEPSTKDLAELCPIMIQDRTYQEWKPWCDENLLVPIMTIKDMEVVPNEWTDVAIIGRTDPRKYFNPRNKAEEAKSKGLAFDMDEGKTESDYDFLNFDLEDETDFTTVRISHKHYPSYKDMMWDIKPDDVILVVGTAIGTIRMAFARKVFNLTKLKQKLESNEKLSKEEKDILTAYGSFDGEPAWV